MTAEERFTKIENAIHSLIEAQAEHTAQIDKHNVAIRDLIVVSRTALTAVEGLKTVQQHTDEKLNILIDTVDRIVRNRNGDKDKS
jgi:hypothetical protein